MTVTITTIEENELVTHELSNVVAIVKAYEYIMFVYGDNDETDETVKFKYNDITFTVR